MQWDVQNKWAELLIVKSGEQITDSIFLVVITDRRWLCDFQKVGTKVCSTWWTWMLCVWTLWSIHLWRGLGMNLLFFQISSVFPLVCETRPKKESFTVWYLRYCGATFLSVSGDVDLDRGYLVVAVKTEDDVCSLECKQEVLQLRAVQCAQASVRLANSGHHSDYDFTLLLNFLTETIHGSHSKWLHMHNIKWEWYIISRFLAHGRIGSDI